MGRLICHDCGVDYDLYEVEGHNRSGGDNVTLCSDCIEEREEEGED